MTKEETVKHLTQSAAIAILTAMQRQQKTHEQADTALGYKLGTVRGIIGILIDGDEHGIITVRQLGEIMWSLDVQFDMDFGPRRY